MTPALALQRLRLLVCGAGLCLLLGCGGSSNAQGSPVADFEAGVWMGPQLGIVTTSSVTVRWDTLMPVPCVVRYGPPSDPEQLETTTPPGTVHEVTISGLTPSTLYHYSLHIDGAPATRSHTFRTGTDDPTAPVRIVVLGDVGCGCDVEIAAAAQINTLAPDLVLFTGDLAYPESSPATFRARFLIPFASVMNHIPIYAAIGNHDADASDAAAVFSALALPRNSVDGSEQYYSHAFGAVSFTAINAEWGLESPAAVQVLWLDGQLQADTHPWKLVFGHRPAYSRGAHPNHADMINHVVPVLDAGNVDFCLSGHDHDYQRTYPMQNNAPDLSELTDINDPIGPTYIVTGGGGASLYEVTPGLPMAVVESVHHITVIDILDNVARVRALRRDNSVVDEFTVTKTP